MLCCCSVRSCDSSWRRICSRGSSQSGVSLALWTEHRGQDPQRRAVQPPASLTDRETFSIDASLIKVDRARRRVSREDEASRAIALV